MSAQVDDTGYVTVVWCSEPGCESWSEGADTLTMARRAAAQHESVRHPELRTAYQAWRHHARKFGLQDM